MDVEFLVQGVIAMLVITAPPDPVKVLIFNAAIARDGTPRLAGALRVALTVLLILGGMALVGRELLRLLGIDLNAFTVVGGIVVAGMGFEMLYAGAPSKAQGRKEEEEGPQEDSGLLMPLSIPLIAGPGAIATSITISTSRDDGWIAAVIGSAGVALVAFLSYYLLGGALSRVSAKTTSLLVRIGGLLLATIGTQMLLNGIKGFFAA